jgi:hypothetical protein
MTERLSPRLGILTIRRDAYGNKQRVMSKRPWIRTLAWAVAIFVTSCFVVSASELIDWVRAASGSEAFTQGFAAFWQAYGVFIVKGWHATEYALLFALVFAALRKVTHWPPPVRCAVALAFCVLFAASDEWHQTFVPHRDGTLRDVLIDTAGAALAAGYLCVRSRTEPAAPVADDFDKL